MKYICRFILLICIFFTSIIASFAFDGNISIQISERKSDTISAIQYNNKDIIYSKDNEILENTISRNDSVFLNNRKSSNIYDGGINNLGFIISNQFQSLLYYIYTLSYLEHKSNSVFSFLSNEIQPNAP